MLPSFCRKSVTVERAPLVSLRGTEVRDWTNSVTHAEGGCDVQPASSSTTWANLGSPSTVRLTLRMPPGADIETGDRVTVDGTTYAVEGAPHEWTSPSGAVTHIEVQLADWR